ncbi:MAG: TPM domain-containing protein [Fimbriimonadia bacterium]|nr:TPM domain-containing protein [Fimbriimonadia bacterium]
MKCPHCGWITEESSALCRGCGFGLEQLRAKIAHAPPRAGFCNDFASFLTPQEREQLEEALQTMSQRLGGEIVWVTKPDTKPLLPSEYVFYLFNEWRVGGEETNGLLMLIAKRERRVECEVGYGWERFVSDKETFELLDQIVVPRLKGSQYFEAMMEGARRASQELQARMELIAGGDPHEKA